MTQQEIIKMMKHFMITRFYTQEDMARKLGVCQATISNWINGKRNIGAKALLKLMEIIQNEST